jgi:hypothetical protein
MIALVFLAFLLMSAKGAASSTTDPVTGYSSGSVEDQQLRTRLRQWGYEGGGTVADAFDPITGRRYRSLEEQQIRAFLTQSGYEGGGTVVRGRPRSALLFHGDARLHE